MRLTLVRHPRPDAADGLCYGRTDLPIAAGQLQQVLAALPAALPPHAGPATPATPVALYSSPLRRCRELAEHLAQMRGAPLTIDARLAEMNFGAWEMQPWDSIPRSDIDAWAADLAGYRPGGHGANRASGGETVLEVAARVSAFLADLQRQRQDAIIVCHAGTMRMLAACQAGLSLHETALRAAQQPHAIPYGGTLIIDL